MDIHFEDLQKLLNKVDSPAHKQQFSKLLTWIASNYPDMDMAIKWQQAHFSHKGTFIVALNTAKPHISFFIEKAGIRRFQDKIEAKGYDHTELLFKVKWTDNLDEQLLKEIIDFQIADKAGLTSYWRKEDE